MIYDIEGFPYVVQVAESVHIENISEAGREAKVLEEAGEHMPRVTLRKTKYEYLNSIDEGAGVLT